MSLAAADGLRCLLHHYQFLLESVPFDAFKSLAVQDAILWQASDYIITAKMEHVIANEGEITLHFREGVHPLYGLSFSFVPGDCLSLDHGHAILISRMQGRIGEAARIMRATKACGEITPQASLYAALLGVAAATGVECLAGVGAVNQVCYEDSRSELFVRAYDHFFESVAGSSRRGGVFTLPLPPEVKPLSEIARSHRRRTKIKRQMKNAITDAAQANWPRRAAS